MVTDLDWPFCNIIEPERHWKRKETKISLPLLPLLFWDPLWPHSTQVRQQKTAQRELMTAWNCCQILTSSYWDRWLQNWMLEFQLVELSELDLAQLASTLYKQTGLYSLKILKNYLLRVFVVFKIKNRTTNATAENLDAA